MVIVAAMILPLTLLLAFALETGWWWTHHRHLQTQADAGALAGAQGPWFLGSDSSGCDETTIETNTRQYSSDLGIGISGGGSNAQYSNATNVHTLINAMNPPNGPRYWWDPDPAKTGSDFSDGSTPCQSLLANNGHLDVNVTDAGLPTFFGSLPFFGRAVRSVNVQGFDGRRLTMRIATPDQTDSGNPTLLVLVALLGFLVLAATENDATSVRTRAS